jgi:hypothetical protein
MTVVESPSAPLLIKLFIIENLEKILVIDILITQHLAVGDGEAMYHSSSI